MKLATKHKSDPCFSSFSREKSPFLQKKLRSGGSRPKIKTKLKIGQPHNKSEREADAMAERVMRMPMESPGAVMEKQDQEGVLLKFAACKDLEQTKPQASDIAKPSIARASRSGQPNASKGGGSAVSTSLSRRMSHAFGHDFGHVKIHTGPRAQQMNDELNARAFTHGSDIYFNKGEYAPIFLTWEKTTGP